ncbi:MAG: hypothetical protein R2822_28300 [Spirosomataceae bacterium]
MAFTWRLMEQSMIFQLSNTDLKFGKNSYLRGDLAFKDVVNWRMFMDFKLNNNSRVDAVDLRQYYPEKSFNDIVQPFGVVNFTGKYAGTLDRFKLNGDFKTAMGSVNVKALEMNLSATVPTYIADIKTQNFDLGKLLEDSSFSHVDLHGKIVGERI